MCYWCPVIDEKVGDCFWIKLSQLEHTRLLRQLVFQSAHSKRTFAVLPSFRPQIGRCTQLLVLKCKRDGFIFLPGKHVTNASENISEPTNLFKARGRRWSTMVTLWTHLGQLEASIAYSTKLGRTTLFVGQVFQLIHWRGRRLEAHL